MASCHLCTKEHQNLEIDLHTKTILMLLRENSSENNLLLYETTLFRTNTQFTTSEISTNNTKYAFTSSNLSSKTRKS